MDSGGGGDRDLNRAQPEGGYQLFPEGRPQAEAVSGAG